MAGPAPPFNRGRLVLVLFGIAAGVAAAWLLVRAPQAPVSQVRPDTAGPEQPIAFYLARADAARGAAFFQRCAACHTSAEGALHGLGPNLWGVMGRPVASRPGFTYSPALRAHGGSWDWEAAGRFLRSPRDAVPGTRMTFYGVMNPQDRADVLLYLNGQGGSLAAPTGAR
jgi:cytochrome c2